MLCPGEGIDVDIPKKSGTTRFVHRVSLEIRCFFVCIGSRNRAQRCLRDDANPFPKIMIIEIQYLQELRL